MATKTLDPKHIPCKAMDPDELGEPTPGKVFVQMLWPVESNQDGEICTFSEEIVDREMGKPHDKRRFKVIKRASKPAPKTENRMKQRI